VVFENFYLESLYFRFLLLLHKLLILKNLLTRVCIYHLKLTNYRSIFFTGDGAVFISKCISMIEKIKN